MRAVQLLRDTPSQRNATMRFATTIAALCLPHVLSGATDADRLQFFESKIRPVLATRCYPCHSAKAAKPQAGLLLDSQAGVRRGGNSGAIIEAGDPEKSLLVRAIRYQDANLKMPPGKPLTADVVADFESWIRDGA